MCHLIARLVCLVWLCLVMPGCASVGDHPPHLRVIGHGMPDVDLDNAIYEVAVKPGVTYQELVDSLKSLSEGMNFVSPATFPLGEHMQKRGQDPQGIKEVRTFCNLSMGTEIILDHPEFLVFAPCRLAIYEKPDTTGKRQLYLGLDRPTYDLKNIRHPTARAQASAQQLENALIELMDKASRGDF